MKLLHKTLFNYLLFSVFIFLISTVVFYFLVQNLWENDVDESLIYQKEKIIEGLKAGTFEDTVVENFTRNAQKLGVEVSIVPVTGSSPNAEFFRNETYPDPVRNHAEPFREMVSLIQVNGKNYKITVRKDLVESADLILEIIIAQAILFLILLIGSLFFNNSFSKRIWQPFYELVVRVKSFRIDKQEVLVAPETRITEFDELGEAIERLTRDAIRTFSTQKEFTENAAHETQTPLAVIKTQLDLLAQDENLTEQQSEIITRIEKNVRILSKLNRNLLLLARIENEQVDKTGQTNISAVVDETCSALEEEIKMKGLTLSLSLLPDVPVISNEHLVHSLVANLITNAIRYNIPRGRIDIQLSNDRFEITNTGQGHSLDESRIFERFYNSKGAGGSGLGLAIAKKICLTLGYELNYRFSMPDHHTFTVKFT